MKLLNKLFESNSTQKLKLYNDIHSICGAISHSNTNFDVFLTSIVVQSSLSEIHFRVLHLSFEGSLHMLKRYVNSIANIQ